MFVRDPDEAIFVAPPVNVLLLSNSNTVPSKVKVLPSLSSPVSLPPENLKGVLTIEKEAPLVPPVTPTLPAAPVSNENTVNVACPEPVVYETPNPWFPIDVERLFQNCASVVVEEST